jgi:hypothetical protein
MVFPLWNLPDQPGCIAGEAGTERKPPCLHVSHESFQIIGLDSEWGIDKILLFDGENIRRMELHVNGYWPNACISIVIMNIL